MNVTSMTLIIFLVSTLAPTVYLAGFSVGLAAANPFTGQVSIDTSGNNFINQAGCETNLVTNQVTCTKIAPTAPSGIYGAFFGFGYWLYSLGFVGQVIDYLALTGVILYAYGMPGWFSAVYQVAIWIDIAVFLVYLIANRPGVEPN